MEKFTKDILLVEDNPSDAKFTMIALKKANVANNIIHLKDGAEALDYIFAAGAFEKRKIEEVPCLKIGRASCRERV